MSNIVAVPLSGGEEILFAPVGSGGAQAFAGNPTVIQAVESLDDAIDQVRKIASAMSERLAGLDFETAEATLGLTITGKGKFIVAEASAEASLGFKIVFKSGRNNTTG